MSVTRFWTVVPAAGSARRMGAGATPKQYLSIAGATVIEHALRPFLAHSACQGIVVALAADDAQWSRLTCVRDPRIKTVDGGKERAESVLAGLESLAHLAAEDWVLVHDAARPCLSAVDLNALLDTLADDEVGGLLAAPVVDTLKRVAGNRVERTEDRSALWQALTPQMFRYGTLLRALRSLRERGIAHTDEAQAVESLGLRPRVVLGSVDNLKITVPDDLARAERVLTQRAARS